ncbi:hypothetical protein N792_09580 [Lysobacter concretionis Ko07 = DSM 16239]|jgi:uncharacterized lipoprotein|uniref:Beta-barrel assembly machine subunit BamC n=1 Tax=Lysobacter concretionis Ko07 = DSM 16239 TaxID=1122185 RepID=A0A0A0ELM3_9GAMM|nr:MULTISPECIES: hypothetical protein [Lysobacter]KGM51871.1 hypothetical protein N792_09580 [Lysobacter concretionis Ko07 = DSM 16239]QOD92050.1 hypothetical protein H2514_05335 [Lysobacter sp. CW239]
MRSTVPLSRAAIAGALVVGLVAVSGCSWLRKDDALYTAQTRPLEVPPDLDLPRTTSAMASPAGTPAGTVTASGTVAAAQAAPVAGTSTGFVVAGSRDEVFEKVDAALTAVDGLTIASRAKLLGAFDVNYLDSNFLVRVSETEAGAYVSAVDPRGMPATGEAPVQLVAALKTALGGH